MNEIETIYKRDSVEQQSDKEADFEEYHQHVTQVMSDNIAVAKQ